MVVRTRMMMLSRLAWIVSATLLTIGCNKHEPSGDVSGKESAAAERLLVDGPAPGPTGYKWERLPDAAAGSVEVPTGEGWKKETGDSPGVSNESLDITVMIQPQADVPAEARTEYLKSLGEVNKRDAPKYELVKQDEGRVGPKSAGRLDGKFDNGTAYVTRDYVLFVKGSALAIMVRGPVAKEADVKAIADHVAASHQ